MVTEKDIINMGRKIKRTNNPQTLARYQAQIDAWIAELNSDLTQTQTNILALEEKIKLEEEAHAAENKREQDPDTGRFIPASLPGIPPGETTKKVAVKIAEKAGVSPRKCYSYFEFERLHLRRSRF
jgi:hypothetical protein